jgi:hypothetical protein
MSQCGFDGSPFHGGLLWNLLSNLPSVNPHPVTLSAQTMATRTATSESAPMPRLYTPTQLHTLYPCCSSCHVKDGPAVCVQRRKSKNLLIPCAPRDRIDSSLSQSTLPFMFHPATRGKKLARAYQFSYETSESVSAKWSISELQRLQRQGGLTITFLSVVATYPTPLSGRFGMNSQALE